MVFVLEASERFFIAKSWLSQRRSYLAQTPITVVSDEGYKREDDLIREMMFIAELLEPAELKKYFNYDKKKRHYRCPDCCREYAYGKTPLLATLEPNTPESNTIFCITCDKKFDIERKKCVVPDCKGNVIFRSDYIELGFVYEECLTCGDPQNT
jgi:hypothetical protein